MTLKTIQQHKIMGIPWINLMQGIHSLLSSECHLEGNVSWLGTSGELVLLCCSVTFVEMGKSWCVFRKDILQSGFMFTTQYIQIKLRITQ